MSIPYVGKVLNGWTKKTQCYFVTQTVIDYVPVNTAQVKTIPLFIVPLRVWEIERKPEKERVWKWYSLLEPVRYSELRVNDLILINGVFFRIDSRQPWNSAGYRRYQATEYFEGSGPIYSVIYKSNGADSGNPPAQYAYQENTDTVVSGSGSLIKDGYSFTRWNTESDGTGTAYAEGDTLTVGNANITLYAQWEEST